MENAGSWADDRSFLDQFEAASIPSDFWTHERHLRMAFLYLRSLDFDLALTRMRDGIRKLNAANEVPENEESGYHETLTVVWARIVADSVGRCADAASFAEFIPQNSALLDKRLVLQYYSRARILSTEARACWVEPDLAPLPGLPCDDL